MLSFMFISDVYMSLIPDKTTFNKYWGYRELGVLKSTKTAPGKLDLIGIVNETVYKTESIFTGLGHGKSAYFLPLSLP